MPLLAPTLAASSHSWFLMTSIFILHEPPARGGIVLLRLQSLRCNGPLTGGRASPKKFLKIGWSWRTSGRVEASSAVRRALRGPADLSSLSLVSHTADLLADQASSRLEVHHDRQKLTVVFITLGAGSRLAFLAPAHRARAKTYQASSHLLDYLRNCSEHERGVLLACVCRWHRSDRSNHRKSWC